MNRFLGENRGMIRVHHLFVSAGHNFVGHHGQPPGECPIVAVAEIDCVAGRGIRGDRYFDFKEDYKGQITFCSLDVFDALRRELNQPDAQPQATRRNAFTRNADLNSLIGREFEIQGVRFAGVEECKPCGWMDRVLGPGAEEWLKGRGGLRGRLDVVVAEGRREGKRFAKASIEHQQAMVRAEATQTLFDGAQQALKANLTQAGALDELLAKATERSTKLEPRRTIRKLDVALDTVLTATKLTAALLITFVVREYLAAMPMTPQTFASRLFGVRGRRETRPDEERVIFYENRRDPAVNAAIADACKRLNKRRLVRDGRKLSYAIEPPPKLRPLRAKTRFN